MVKVRQYWMTYSGPCFLAVVWFGSSPPPLSGQQVVSLSHSSCLSSVLRGEGENHRKTSKPGPSMNHSILSGWSLTREEGGESRVQPCSPRLGSEPAADRPTGCSSRWQRKKIQVFTWVSDPDSIRIQSGQWIRIRIRIQSGQWIRIQIRNPDRIQKGRNDPQNKIKKFHVLKCWMLSFEGL